MMRMPGYLKPESRRVAPVAMVTRIPGTRRHAPAIVAEIASSIAGR
jgi:hypothetical protein